jgi:hypothetical protein
MYLIIYAVALRWQLELDLDDQRLFSNTLPRSCPTVPNLRATIWVTLLTNEIEADASAVDF